MLNGTSSYKKRHLSAPNVIRAVHFSLQLSLSLLHCKLCRVVFSKRWHIGRKQRRLGNCTSLAHYIAVLECPTKSSEHKYSYVELLGGPSATNTAWLWSLEASVLTHGGGYHRVAG